ncbi:tetratricopeptide repeat protein [Thalassotalea hakodatensis]|uniref:hypothetical protein n=1 Tax=Thalassotalea hakodatensis TaxID=3030492 RepID=UPI00257401A9|nr:hypothetical protein [Thalassotalea hakodatensis]
MKLLYAIFLWLNLGWSLNSLQASDDLATLFKKASVALAIDLDKAESLIEKALSLEPNNPEVNFLCGRIMGRQAEDAIFTAMSYANKSLSCLKKAVELQPNKVVYRIGLLNFYLGAPSIAGGDIELASEQVAAIYQLNSVQGALAEIKLLREQDKKDVLKSKLIKWSAKYPKINEFTFRLGLIYQDESNFREAFKAFEQAASSQEQQIYYLNSLYQLGRNAVFSHYNVQEGINSLLIFIAESDGDKGVPSNEWAALRLAQLYRLIENDELTRKYVKLAEKSDERELHRVLKKIYNVR